MGYIQVAISNIFFRNYVIMHRAIVRTVRLRGRTETLTQTPNICYTLGNYNGCI